MRRSATSGGHSTAPRCTGRRTGARAEGFPDAWWWGQAQAFADPGACVAFAGGQVHSGPLRAEVTAVVVRLPTARSSAWATRHVARDRPGHRHDVGPPRALARRLGRSTSAGMPRSATRTSRGSCCRRSAATPPGPRAPRRDDVGDVAAARSSGVGGARTSRPSNTAAFQGRGGVAAARHTGLCGSHARGSRLLTRRGEQIAAGDRAAFAPRLAGSGRGAGLTQVSPLEALDCRRQPDRRLEHRVVPGVGQHLDGRVVSTAFQVWLTVAHRAPGRSPGAGRASGVSFPRPGQKSRHWPRPGQPRKPLDGAVRAAPVDDRLHRRGESRLPVVVDDPEAATVVVGAP